MAIRAVTMDFAIVGEAAKQIPDETKRKYPQIPLRQMAGIQDKTIHGSIHSQTVFRRFYVCGF
jgi:uncharacterized protein with HEPN domain